jgi:hypothetical protein
MDDQYGMVEFFTHQYRVTGTTWMGGQRLTDLLNDKRTSTLDLTQVEIRRVIAPRQVVAAYRSAVLDKQRIVFALIAGEGADGKASRFYKHVEKVEWDVFVTVPFFELSGKLHVRGKGDLLTMVMDWTGQFIPITEARAVFTIYPEVTFEGEVIVFNKAHMEVICSDARPLI